MRRYFSSLLLLLLLAACDSQVASADCDAECDRLKILARRGDAPAQTALGRMYFNGTGLPKDEAQAVSLWSQAAAQNYAPAEKFLAQAYLCGVGGLRSDKEKAAALFQKAKSDASEN
ncbi:MAG TPA: hypothetical protein VFI14_03600 [Chryseosolibacter sp.]|nr:hypothetical protein [Chryseosolibacter sp.]